MGEPITIYDKKGVIHTFFGAAQVAELVASGEYSYEPPEKRQGKASGDVAPGVETSEKTEKPNASKGKSDK